MAKDQKLEKKLSPLNVWALAFGCIIGWGAFVMPGNTFLVKSGPLGTAIAMVVASLVMIIIAFNYSYMIKQYPIAGGEFTYAQKAFGQNHAFVCSWFLGLSYLAIVPLNATALALIGRNLMGSVFQFGFHYVVAGYDVYLGEICLALVALLFFAYLSIKGVKFAGVFQTMLACALIGGVALVVVAALVCPEAQWSNLAPAYHPGSSEISCIIAVVAVAPWAFVGFDTIPQAAEEFNFSPTKGKMIMVISILFGGLVYVLLNGVTAMVVPDGYANWLEYIDDLKNLDGLMSLPTFNAAHMMLGTWGLVFLGIAVLSACLSGIVGFYMATSRLLFSMSREGVLPKWFGELHPTHKTPMNAILFVMAIALVAPFFGRTALGWIVDMSSLGAAIGYGYTSAAALKYAIERKDAGIIFTGVIGIIMAAAFTVLLLVPIKMFNCSLGIESYICLGIWVILGFIFYVSSLKKRKTACDKKS
ncbi:APC family permease [Sodaliphilus sp.]|uniref:APC family permease n=1 Tax=Sodaliphilus sp. TaxID=2815818 RepID=UPI00388DF231